MADRDDIEQAVHATLNEFRHAPHVTPASINRGECEAFAEAVNDRLDGALDIVTTADIIGEEPSQKPEPWHVWLSDGERHYDAEHPRGVESWGELGFFTRISAKEPSLN